MPLFEYLCKKCGALHEVFVRGDKEPICPECGAPPLVKQIGAFNPVGRSPSTRCAAQCRQTRRCPFQ